MKIKELKSLMLHAISLLNPKYEEANQAGTKISAFSNLENYREGIELLGSTNLLDREINIIRKSPIFTTGKDFINININEGRSLRNSVDEILTIVKAVARSINQIGNEEAEDSISIKLPEIKDFDDLSKYSAQFHKIFSQTIINEQIGGKVRIDNVENGSIWLDVCLGSTAAVSVIGGLAWSAAVVYKKIQEGKIV